LVEWIWICYVWDWFGIYVILVLVSVLLLCDWFGVVGLTFGGGLMV